MATPYTAVFYNNGTQIGSTSGNLGDDNVQDGTNSLANYFKNGGLAVESINVGAWTSLTITVNGQDYNYNR
jgi:hypothetical protein